MLIGFKKIILGFPVGWGERSEPQLNQDVGVHSVHPNLLQNNYFKSYRALSYQIVFKVQGMPLFLTTKDTKRHEKTEFGMPYFESELVSTLILCAEV